LPEASGRPHDKLKAIPRDECGVIVGCAVTLPVAAVYRAVRRELTEMSSRRKEVGTRDVLPASRGL